MAAMSIVFGIPSDQIEQARDANLITVAARYGVTLRRAATNEFAGACPVCGGKDRFGVNVRKKVFNCRGCGVGGDAIALVMHVERCGFREAVEKLTGASLTPTPPKRPVPIATCAEADDGAAERAKAQWFCRRRRPIAETIAETYLRRARGYGGAIPATLAYLPPSNGHEPALIAAFGIATEPEPGVLAIADDAVMAIQLVKLKSDGSGKAEVEPNKIIIGRGALGSPIVLAPPNDLLGLVITEGLEDALSIHEATGLGAWASGGAGRMEALAAAVPNYIDFVTIVPDRDPAGIKGANALADELSRKRKIECCVAPLDGGDT